MHLVDDRPVADSSKRRGEELKGFVPTPGHLVDDMVAKLFAEEPPRAASKLLDPGCGPGAFIDGVLRWCDRNEHPIPKITGIESDHKRAAAARRRFSSVRSVAIREADFLVPDADQYDYIIGNPPYVSIGRMSEVEKTRYRREYRTAKGRFDLYILFFEGALRQLKPGGRLVFVTPEKFAYVETARELRQLLAERWVQEIHHLPEESFDGLVTYPAVTTLVNASPGPTRLVLRNGSEKAAVLPRGGSSWMPLMTGERQRAKTTVLEDICLRVSCGVATGADGVFVLRDTEVPSTLARFAYPTIAGRQISQHGMANGTTILVPYDRHGNLLPEGDLGSLRAYLAQNRDRLLRRTCVRKKPWYAFHETPQLPHILRPKILCKDIAADPFFVTDEKGDLIPRHSVYYIVPNDPAQLHDLAAYLNSSQAKAWLRGHCQRAANGSVRLQSHVLKQLPVPSWFASGIVRSEPLGAQA